MIRFQYPELFLLALPIGWLFWRYGRASGMTGWLRGLIVLLLLCAVTGPQIDIGGEGVDVMVIVDRSRSLPEAAPESIQEILQNLQNGRREGDRVGVVSFGGDTAIEQYLSETETLTTFNQQVLPDGSDLNEAILKSLALLDPNRPARILVLSDGESNGASPLSAARRARDEGVPIDYRLYERPKVGDVAVDAVQLPEEVTPREPFQYSVLIHADLARQGKVTIKRDGRAIETRDASFRAGNNRLVFRDILESGGFYNYDVVVDIEGDPVRENNTGAGLIRVDAGPRVLVLSADGSESNLVRSLKAARIPVDVSTAKMHPLSQDALDPYRAVIIENTPARDLGREKMERLSQYVEDLGGGLLLTGGERSFGNGGYFNSPLDPVMPVSMELREEHRKLRMALTIALDRSGSMSVPVAGGKTKMDLANIGTASAIRMLGASDMTAVLAVDTMPHIVQELTTVDNPEAIAKRVLSIESTGGGIYVYNALLGAGLQLDKAQDYSTRHIILFADASDSVEPGKYKDLLKQFEASGITVSVIGLGKKSDVDAPLLMEIAKLGNGNIMFTEDPKELPRMFAEDTMSVARSSFIKAEDEFLGIGGELVPDLRLLGDLPADQFPTVGGYNLCYLKPEATLGIVSQDEYTAPFFAFWYRGLGRAAALTLEVDGKFTGEFGDWGTYDDFMITQTRWLLGGQNPNDVFVEIERAGQDAIVRVELDPQRSGSPDKAPELIVVPPGNERVGRLTPQFVWTGPNTLEARFRLDRVGSYRTLVKTGPQQFTRGPALTLPYSPEFVPRAGEPSGQQVLESIAELSNGQERTDVLEVLLNPPRSSKVIFLLRWLMIAALVLLVIEIAGRRLGLWDMFRKQAMPVLASDAGPVVESKPGWLPQWRMKRAETKAEKRAAKVAAKSSPVPTSKAPDAPSAAPQKSQKEIFAAAKERAKRRRGE